MLVNYQATLENRQAYLAHRQASLVNSSTFLVRPCFTVTGSRDFYPVPRPRNLALGKITPLLFFIKPRINEHMRGIWRRSIEFADS
jgi:hypothetical protein